ncbi:hypothetical protein ABLU29_07605 [Lactococcus lactis]|uniref:hypothetical protein n=1 Tax=Lactococcus lactis TaxID=1358 RepID=UPI0038779E91
MTITNEIQDEDGVRTFTFEFIKREDMPYPNYTKEKWAKITDTLIRGFLRQLWDSLETEEEKAQFRLVNGSIFDKESE